jgi:hypothetical protein
MAGQHIRAAFAEPFARSVKKAAGRGRSCLQAWPDVLIATVIKRTEKQRVVQITRRMTHGQLEQAERLLQRSQGGTVLNTAFLERLNGTMRQRLATLTRKCRHAARRLQTLESGMYLVGCTYKLCFPHHELSNEKHFGSPCTPAMAAALTDHVWSRQELLGYRIPPLAFVAPKRRGRPRTRPQPSANAPRRAVLRLRKGVLCPTTS